MSVYAFKTENSLNVTDWVKATKERGKQDNMLKNPFHWRIKTIKKKADLFVVVEAKPIYFNFSWFGWATGLGILFVFGATPWVWPFLGIGCLGIFWTAEPLFLLTKKALRKHGYSGPIKRLKYSALIREVVL